MKFDIDVTQYTSLDTRLQIWEMQAQLERKTKLAKIYGDSLLLLAFWVIAWLSL